MTQSPRPDLEIIRKTPAERTLDRPVLFVHGAWHGAWCWNRFMEYFAGAGIETIAFSFRGHGESKYPRSINSLGIGDYVDDLRQVAGSLAVEPIIVAHSMGGLVLQKFLEKDRCAGAVLVTPVPPSGVLRTALNINLTKPYGLPSILTANLYGLVNDARKAKWAFFSDRLAREDLEEFTERLGGESFLAFLGMLYPGIRINFHTQIPILVVAAENDNIFTVSEGRRTAKKYDADFELLEDFPHDVMLEPNYQEAADRIIDWIRAHGFD